MFIMQAAICIYNQWNFRGRAMPPDGRMWLMRVSPQADVALADGTSAAPFVPMAECSRGDVATASMAMLHSRLSRTTPIAAWQADRWARVTMQGAVLQSVFKWVRGVRRQAILGSCHCGELALPLDALVDGTLVVASQSLACLRTLLTAPAWCFTYGIMRCGFTAAPSQHGRGSMHPLRNV